MKILDFLLDKIKKHRKLLLIFDYDGTLTFIANSPSEANLDKKVKESIEKLALSDFVKIAIVTGRRVDDLKQVSGINNAGIKIYGLHGGEIPVNNHYVVDVSSKALKKLNDFKNSVSDLLKLPGILLEDKTYSISLHYRLAQEKVAREAVDIFMRKAREFGLKGDFKYQEGKKVIEIMPANFDKSKAIDSLVKEYKDYLPVFFGDDATDIKGLEEIKKFNGIAVDVDREASVSDVQSFILSAANFACPVHDN